MPKLLDAGYAVVVYDLMLFGRNGLAPHPNLHLACISNDPSFELDPHLSKSINYDCFEPMVVAAKSAGVRRFVYASTSSVYGVSDCPGHIWNVLGGSPPRMRLLTDASSALPAPPGAG